MVHFIFINDRYSVVFIQKLKWKKCVFAINHFHLQYHIRTKSTMKIIVIELLLNAWNLSSRFIICIKMMSISLNKGRECFSIKTYICRFWTLLFYKTFDYKTQPINDGYFPRISSLFCLNKNYVTVFYFIFYMVISIQVKMG